MEKGKTVLVKKKPKINWSRIKNKLTPFFIISPYLALFIIFFVLPFLYGIFISFFDWNLFFPQETSYVGFANYQKILFDTGSIFYTYFWTGLKIQSASCNYHVL